MRLSYLLLKALASCGMIKSSGGVINLHRVNTKNCGDLYSAPYRYFKDLSKFPVYDISESINGSIMDAAYLGRNEIGDSIIVGGGGFLERKSFLKSMELMRLLAKKGKKVVLWGVGHNSPNGGISDLIYRQIDAYKVIGLRDYGINGADWVPCASCLHDVFDKNYMRLYEFGVVEHEHILIPDENHRFKFPKIKNTTNFEELIGFIGSVDCLLTNSYHAMYWGMLLERKVVVFPNSSKMYGFKYQPSICNDISDYKEAVKSAQLYDGLLDEFRMENLKFADKVYDYLGL